MSNWVDTHSVTCYFCGKLFDEREGQPADEFNDNDGGDICPTCLTEKTFGKPISAYTWDDAVEDGLFVEVTNLAKKSGYAVPTAITTSAYCRIIDFDQADENLSDARLTRLLFHVRAELAIKSEEDYPIFFEYMGHRMIVSMEGRNMENPEPVLTIMLAEDY